MRHLQAPFPWFGGKSRVADLVWQRFGDVPNYVEPFFGSGAVMLARPHVPRIETINDKDGFVCNFWRAVQTQPELVARYAADPVSECDLHARHARLVRSRDGLTRLLEGDPGYNDPHLAGWWVWGLCCWIGSGWCAGAGPWRVEMDDQGRDVLIKVDADGSAGRGVNRQRPHLGDAGRGVNRQLPHLGDAGRGAYQARIDWLCEWFGELRDRLANVRICCGDWARICGPSHTTKRGITGVFLDPPYSAEADRYGAIYAVEDLSVAHDVREWAIAHSNDPMMRIALCGYEGEHAMQDGWECVAWKAAGGYGGQNVLGKAGRGEVNRHRERIWFSPHCLSTTHKQAELFEEAV